jgi:hypothetical protein
MDQRIVKDLSLVAEKLDMKAKSLDFPKTILATPALSNLNGLSLEDKFINALILSCKTKKVTYIDSSLKFILVADCSGKCQNGGVFINGECRCRSGYSGNYCQYKGNFFFVLNFNSNPL